MDFSFFVYPGYYTGSVFNDHQLKNNGFPGEGLRSGKVIAIKTHYYGSECSPKYDKVILLMRHPVETILSDFNGQASSNRTNNYHTRKAHPALFNTKGKFFTDKCVKG